MRVVRNRLRGVLTIRVDVVRLAELNKQPVAIPRGIRKTQAAPAPSFDLPWFFTYRSIIPQSALSSTVAA